MEELKILQKAYDMVQYGHVCLRRFPKSERHTLAAEIKRHMFQILRLILQANRRRDKLAALAEKKAKGQLKLEDVDEKLSVIIEMLEELLAR